MKNFFWVVGLMSAFSTFSQTPQGVIPTRQYSTKSMGNETIVFDGKLDDAVWETVAWGADFTENQPDDGTAPSQKTQFKILYDEKYLIIGARCFDTAPDSLVARMSRRDEFPGDWIEINIDSYHDLRTAFSFTYSVSGVRGDEFISNNGGNWDDSWNPIWDGKSQIDSLGWTAEIKIPFSQLRYGNQAEPVWGFQVQRLVFRKNERSIFQYIPRTSAGWVSQFAELHGLKNLPSNKNIEIAPYFVAKTEHFPAEAGNPFADGSSQSLTAGVDGKVGITRDLTLDFTINPDFGQVEADPGAIRLDGYEVFFQERRPFFVENRNIFGFSATGSQTEGDYDSDILFYSRRIGGAPRGFPQLAPGDYVDVPQNTAILGAGKFSGKTKSGISIGILECVTRRENATVEHLGQTHKELVEPLSNQFVSRLVKDFRKGNTIIGGIFTAVNRENGLDFLHRAAYSGGLDFQHFWKNRWWNFQANAIFSRVEGSTQAITRTQRNFQHLFQRTDADYVTVDTARTALTGTGATAMLGKFGGKPDHWGGVVKFQTGFTYRSPELELNDIGFLQAADEINHFTWCGYQIQKPFSVFNNWRLNYNHNLKWDFGGRLRRVFFNVNTHAFFKNNWGVGTGINLLPLDISNNALRGSTALRNTASISTWNYIQSDERKRVSVSLNTAFSKGLDRTGYSQDYSLSIGFIPLNALQVGLSPAYSQSWRRQDQFVDNVLYNSEVRSIVGEVNQKSFSLTGRISYNLTPDLTIQYYGQPFIFRALYKDYAVVTDPLNKDSDARFHTFSSTEISETDGQFAVDENADGSPDYTFSKPDFNYIQFRSNLVMRWEYIPGSELYVVWSQGAVPNAFGDLTTPLVRSLFDNAFSEKVRNIFLLKMTYRLLR